MNRNNKNKDIGIGAIIKNMYKRYHLDSKVFELKLKEDWKDLFGILIHKHTTEIKVNDKTLYLKVDNPPLKNELFLQRQLIIGKINEYYGQVLIEKVFVSS